MADNVTVVKDLIIDVISSKILSTDSSGLVKANTGIYVISATGVTPIHVTGSTSLTVNIDKAAADGTTLGVATFNSANFSASVGVVNTIQNISSIASPTFVGLTLSGQANFTGSLYSTNWSALSYATNWTDLGSGFQVGQYKKFGDLVFVRGTITSGANLWAANQIIATLPSGSRPPAIVTVPIVVSPRSSGSLDINTDGTMGLYPGPGADTAGYILFNFCFSVGS